MTCLQLVYDLFVTCSWIVHDLFINLFMACLRLVYNFLTTSSWLVHDFFILFHNMSEDTSVLVPCRTEGHAPDIDLGMPLQFVCIWVYLLWCAPFGGGCCMIYKKGSTELKWQTCSAKMLNHKTWRWVNQSIQVGCLEGYEMCNVNYLVHNLAFLHLCSWI